MPINEQVINDQTDSIKLIFKDENGKEIGDLNVVFYPFRFNYDEYTGMRKTLNEGTARQVRIDQLNNALAMKVIEDGQLAVATVAQFSPEPPQGDNVVPMPAPAPAAAPAAPQGITRSQRDQYQRELQELLQQTEDATAFIKNFMVKITKEMDLLDGNNQPFDWSDHKVKNTKIQSLGFPILNLAATSILERVSGGKAQQGSWQRLSLATAT